MTVIENQAIAGTDPGATLDSARPPISCACGRTPFNGDALQTRVLRRTPGRGVQGKCRCKQWLSIPLTYLPNHDSLNDRGEVRCKCGKTVFDGVAVRSRVIRLLDDDEAIALCSCKRWLCVPFKYDP